MIDIRCKSCDKFFGKANIFVGVIKCSRCKLILEYNVYENYLYENPNRVIKEVDSTESKADAN